MSYANDIDFVRRTALTVYCILRTLPSCAGSAVFCQNAAPAKVPQEPGAAQGSGTATSVTIEPGWVAIMAGFAVAVCGIALLSNW